MSKSQWTPGPWYVETTEQSDGDLHQVFSADPGYALALTRHHISQETANLIAAAPDMYEAHEKIYSLLSYVAIHGVGDALPPRADGAPQPARVSVEGFGEILRQISAISSAALAKARGQK